MTADWIVPGLIPRKIPAFVEENTLIRAINRKELGKSVHSAKDDSPEHENKVVHDWQVSGSPRQT